MLLLLSLAAAPMAVAAKPDKVVLGPLDPSITPAGLGCAFDVLVVPGDDIRRTYFEFDDGRLVTLVKGHATYSNDENGGASFLHHVTFRAVDTYDASTNEIVSVTQGQFTVTFWPGDMGPEGIVSSPGEILRFTGKVSWRADADTFAFTEFSYVGKYIDVCAALSA